MIYETTRDTLIHDSRLDSANSNSNNAYIVFLRCILGTLFKMILLNSCPVINKAIKNFLTFIVKIAAWYRNSANISDKCITKVFSFDSSRFYQIIIIM